MITESYDCQVLVIGSGRGGSVTAWTLGSCGKDVLLIEEGPHFRLDSCKPFSIEEMRQKYRNGGLNPAFSSPKVPLVEGCCVGGGSEINSGLYHRTPAEILALWREKNQVRYFGGEVLLPPFRTRESALNVQLNPGISASAAQKMKQGSHLLV